MYSIQIPVKLIVVLGVVALFSSCASLSSLQTGRTMGDNEFGWGVSAGSVNSELLLDDNTSIDISAPLIELGLRYGINEKIDIGLKMALIGTAVVDGKYQFLGNKVSEFAGSVGLGLGYLGIESGDIKSTMTDIMVPTYFSWHPKEKDWLSIYTSPKYILRLNAYDDASDGSSGTSTSHWYGTSTGIRLGNKTAFVLEYAFFGNSLNSNPFTQISGGVAFGIK